MRYETPAYIKEWPGYVILPDALNYTQLNIWQDVTDELAQMQEGITWAEAIANPRMAQKIVHAICLLVKEWHLEKLPEHVSDESFPATPVIQSSLLIGWLHSRLVDLLIGADDTSEKKVE